MAKEKKYKKYDLRLTLQANMRIRRNEPKLTVSPIEFSRMLKCYCEIFNFPADIMRAKELPESFVDSFGAWLGDPLR